MRDHLRKITLHQQGLLKNNTFNILETLNQFINEGHAFEYWYHAASYLPMRDFRFSLVRKNEIKRGESKYYSVKDKKLAKYILDRIRSDGPLKSRDFESEMKTNRSFWSMSPAKKVLETLFMQGDLMITKRIGMQKVYDLTERVLPNNVSVKEPSLDEFSEYLVTSALNSYGFTSLKQITHLRNGAELRKSCLKALNEKISMGVINEFSMDGSLKLYIKPELLDLNIEDSKINILSPFDNAIIHRDRLEYLFNFQYRIECYTPEAKRKYGYFCLPILFQSKIVGRVDCKAHRALKQLELINLYIEDKSLDLDLFIPLFINLVKRFAKFNQCDYIEISNCKPTKFKIIIERALKYS